MAGDGWWVANESAEVRSQVVGGRRVAGGSAEVRSQVAGGGWQVARK